jgi:glyoxylase-like metal-dependent hydrolase (beta-lactamase superfamily II)
VFLDRAGVSPKQTAKLLDMHKWSKDAFAGARVDFTIEAGPLPDSGFYVHHAPGHCPGQVCLQLDDILFTADHVLSHITPNQAPEFITRYTGIGHYLDALRDLLALDGITVALGGHEHEIADLHARVNATIEFHMARLEKARKICDAPKSIQQISLELFGEREEYHVLLAFLETGAHVEYLHERGQLTVANFDEIENENNPVLLYAQT